MGAGASATTETWGNNKPRESRTMDQATNMQDRTKDTQGDDAVIFVH